MESLTEETWDLVIAGTGLVQALLALSLSRSSLKILHVDENSHYGGADAGVSLDEAKAWAERHTDASGSPSSAQISQPQASNGAKLANSRAYTLSLNPQIVYAQSTFLPSLVSSTINTQLEFMAVGSWWIQRQGKLQKVPSSREDVFADEAISRKDKIGLMKFLRYVVQENMEESETQENAFQREALDSVLTSRFKISPDLHLPISSLALVQQSVHDTRFETAVSRIRRHMRSIGYFGPGFGAVVAKYAGNAEIAQVSCRACAVGGATYLLGQGVSGIDASNSTQSVKVTLTNGVTVETKHLVSSVDDLPTQYSSKFRSPSSQCVQVCRSIGIVSTPLRHLFPATSEDGPIPAAAMVLVADSDDVDDTLSKPPVYLQIHSEDTGECPTGQCIIYGSTIHPDNTGLAQTQQRLASAVQKFLAAASDTGSKTADTSLAPELLWSLSYITTGSGASDQQFLQDDSGHVIVFPRQTQDIAFDDGVLASVNAVWNKILGSAADEQEFLRFEDRSGNSAGDE